MVLLRNKEVFWDIVHKECKGMYGSDVSLATENSVCEHASPIVVLEEDRIPLTEVLNNHLHALL